MDAGDIGLRRLVPLLLLASVVAVASVLFLGRAREEATEGKAAPHDADDAGASPLTVLHGRGEGRATSDVADLQGRVVYEDGRTFQGEVHATWMRTGGQEGSRRERTDSVVLRAEGRFELRRLPFGPVRLVATRDDGLRVGSPRLRIPHAGPYLFVLRLEDPALVGRVLDERTDEPVVGARVTAMRSPARLGEISTTTSASGAFALPTSVGRVKVEAEGYVEQSLHMTPGEAVLVRMVRPGRIVGRVLSAGSRTPVAGVRVYAASNDDAEVLTSTTSGSDGRYVIHTATPGDTRLLCLGGGWVGEDLRRVAEVDPRPPVGIAVEPGETIERDLLVVPAARVDGVVLDAEGVPVAEALVLVWWESTSMSLPLAVEETCVTGPQGRFRLTSLPPVTGLILEARATGHPPARSEPLLLSSGRTIPVTLRLAVGEALEVIVTDGETGRGIAGAEISMTVEPSEGAAYGRQGVTDTEGSWRVASVPAGRVRVGARTEGYLPRMHRVEEAGRARRISLALVRPAHIGGRVEVPEGVLYGAVRVVVRPADAPDWARFRRSAVADPDGAFTLEVPPEGVWHVEVRCTGWGTEWGGSVTARPGEEDLMIPLAVTRTWDVGLSDAVDTEAVLRVLGPDGRAVRWARLYVTQGHANGTGTRSQGQHAEHGVHTLRIPSTVQRVGIEVLEARSADGASLAPAHALFDLPLPGEVVVRLDPVAALEGRVVDSHGEGVASVGIVAVADVASEWPGGTTSARWTTRSDAEGRFRLARLGAAPCRLWVDVPPGWLKPQDEVRGQAGGGEVLIRLERGVSVLLTVVDARDLPVPGSLVHVHRAAGRRSVDELESAWVLTADARGQVRIVGLDAEGRYDVDIEPPPWPGYEDLETIHRSGWRPRDETIRLTEQFRIEGTVRRADGLGLPGVRLWWQRPSGDWAVVESDREGRFLLAEAPSSDLVLHVDTSNREVEDPASLPTARVAADASNELVVDPGYVLVVHVEEAEAELGVRYRLTQVRDGAVWVLHRSWRFRAEPLVFLHVDPEHELAFYLGPGRTGRCAYWRGMPPPSGRVEAAWQEGRSIEGGFRLPPGVDSGRVSVGIYQDGPMLEGLLLPGNRFRILGVPAGTWTVTARARLETGRATRTAVVEAGGRVQFDFRTE